MVSISSETLLEKPTFSFERGCRLEIASWLALGTNVHFFLSAVILFLPWTNAGPVHAAKVSVISYVHQTVSGRQCFVIPPDSFLLAP